MNVHTRGVEYERTYGPQQWTVCTHPCPLLSIIRGATAQIYVQLQISRRTARRDRKRNSANCGQRLQKAETEEGHHGVS